jgi:hypothetical protein
MYTLMDMLFLGAALLLLTHLILCLVAARRLKDRGEALKELFGTSSRTVRLLRARCYLPWIRVHLGPLSPTARILVFATRLTGFILSITLLAVIAIAYLIAWS